MKKTMSILAIAGLVLALAPAAQAAPIPLTSANVTYSGTGTTKTIDSIDGLNFNIEAPSSLVITTWDGGQLATRKDLAEDGTILVNNQPSTGQQAYVTDLALNTGWSFDSVSEVFEANLTNNIAPTLTIELDQVVLILFESKGNDSPTVQAYNGTTALGTALTIASGDWGDTGALSGTFSNQAAAAVGISLSDLGVEVDDTVTRFVFSTTNGWDPIEIMVDSNLVPEPATMSVLAIGGLGLLLKRRRRRA
jgi:hypothetical protein